MPERFDRIIPCFAEDSIETPSEAIELSASCPIRVIIRGFYPPDGRLHQRFHCSHKLRDSQDPESFCPLAQMYLKTSAVEAKLD